ncbi:TVP38/TMEM64 family protein [Bacillus sp. FJAT-47783]|uniref:TVP38/TMEM64 family protein n=1 Tax=Bacillus sp. FJAT-47783 TaxID=2922712 RepID=UPI001FAB676C|nr:TVP38/TMEM64 family protein [Bacillus sp. FJAT-47783]
MKKKTVIKFMLLIAIVSALFWINETFLNITPKAIQSWILSFGFFAPIVYMFIYSIRPFVLFPASVLSLAAGLAFGALWGTIYTIIGATIGAVLSFLVAAKLGHSIKNKEWDGRAKTIQIQLEKNGFFYVLLLRLIPLFNFDMISYLAGISKVRFIPFTVATFIGIIPGTFAYNFLGSSFVEGNILIIITAVLVFLLITVVPLIFSKTLREKLGITQK